MATADFARFRHRVNSNVGRSAVDIAPMTDLEDRDGPSFVVDRVHDAMTALADTVLVFRPAQLFATRRPRVRCKTLDPGDESSAVSLLADAL